MEGLYIMNYRSDYGQRKARLCLAIRREHKFIRYNYGLFGDVQSSLQIFPRYGKVFVKING